VIDVMVGVKVEIDEVIVGSTVGLELYPVEEYLSPHC